MLEKAPPGSRESIKRLALELLVRRGYRGLSFGDLAAALGTTRANIHYHFGNKARLIDEVLSDYVSETLGALATIWRDDGLLLPAKIEAIIAYSRKRYLRFNPAPGHVAPWSLISRLRQDEDLLSDTGRASLRRFTDELDGIVRAALAAADQRGELLPQASPQALALLLVNTADNAAPITLAGGGFERLEDSYRAVLHVSGFGRPPS